MSIFRKLQKDFPLYLGKFIVLLKENFSFASCKPVHAYSDAEIDLTPNPRLYIGLSEDERLEKIKQNLIAVGKLWIYKGEPTNPWVLNFPTKTVHSINYSLCFCIKYIAIYDCYIVCHFYLFLYTNQLPILGLFTSK